MEEKIELLMKLDNIRLRQYGNISIPYLTIDSPIEEIRLAIYKANKEKRNKDLVSTQMMVDTMFKCLQESMGDEDSLKELLKDLCDIVKQYLDLEVKSPYENNMKLIIPNIAISICKVLE